VARLVVNIAIVAIIAAIYLVFVRRRETRPRAAVTPRRSESAATQRRDTSAS
jgi:hypothetical protein